MSTLRKNATKVKNKERNETYLWILTLFNPIGLGYTYPVIQNPSAHLCGEEIHRSYTLEIWVEKPPNSWFPGSFSSGHVTTPSLLCLNSPSDLANSWGLTLTVQLLCQSGLELLFSWEPKYMLFSQHKLMNKIGIFWGTFSRQTIETPENCLQHIPGFWKWNEKHAQGRCHVTNNLMLQVKKDHSCWLGNQKELHHLWFAEQTLPMLAMYSWKCHSWFVY